MDGWTRIGLAEASPAPTAREWYSETRALAEAWCDAAEAVAGVDDAAARRHLRRARALGSGHPAIIARADAIEARLGAVAGLDGLTERELEIVRLVARGRTNPEIAAELHLSPRTVRNYLSTAFQKLGLTRRAEIITLLRSRGAAA